MLRGRLPGQRHLCPARDSCELRGVEDDAYLGVVAGPDGDVVVWIAEREYLAHRYARVTHLVEELQARRSHRGPIQPNTRRLEVTGHEVVGAGPRFHGRRRFGRRDRSVVSVVAHASYPSTAVCLDRISETFRCVSTSLK